MTSPRRASLALAAVALVAALTGCPTSNVAPDAYAAPDAFTAPSDAPAPTLDAASCDLSPIPTPLPMLDGSFRVIGPSVMPPTPEGTGDPTGTWLFDEVAFYVTPEAGMNFNASMSAADGTAWLAFDGSEVRLEMLFTLLLADTLAGDVSRATSTRIRGTYELSGSDVVFVPSCVEASMMMGPTPEFDFGVEGDRGMLVIRSTGMLGELVIVLQGTRA